MGVPETPEIWVCRICRIGIHSIESQGPDGVLSWHGWAHSRDPGSHHEPDPVRVSDLPGGEIRTVCDLCLAPDPMNLWFTSSIGGYVNIPGKAKLQVRDRDNAWLVCDECDPLVLAGQLMPVLKRVYSGLQAANPDTPFDTAQRAIIADRVRTFLEARLPPSTRRVF